ncbi:MAG: ATP-dependent 6-phosphofructokinase [Alphaproteobacteria bacterium]|nr:ATP-dependent 6-phosphofructokinase [Alphaproteobacteria bacterium]
MGDTKRIGILTSGGDCSGLNAVIRAVVRRAIGSYGWQVFGIHEGTMGLLRRPLDYEELTLRLFTGNVLRMGGTLLGTTNKGDPFAFPMPDGSVADRSAEVVEGYRELGLDALIAVGGDGSLRILQRLAETGGLNLIAIPKTIDNDVGFTETCVGYNTAVYVATEALDRLQPTAASHSRVIILEVMGRDAGHIALAAGIAGGADVILIPEIPYSLKNVAAKIESLREAGRNHALVVVTESVKTESGEPVGVKDEAGNVRYGGIGQYLGERIAEMTGAQTRVTVLGHLQRGGTPTPRDRLIGSVFGVHAVDLIAQGKFGQMVAWQDRRVVEISIPEVLAHRRDVDPQGTIVGTARGLGISLGD